MDKKSIVPWNHDQVIDGRAKTLFHGIPKQVGKWLIEHPNLHDTVFVWTTNPRRLYEPIEYLDRPL